MADQSSNPLQAASLLIFGGAFQEAINDNKEHGQQKQLTRDNGLGYPRNRQSPGTSSTFYIHAVPFPPVFPRRAKLQMSLENR